MVMKQDVLLLLYMNVHYRFVFFAAKTLPSRPGMQIPPPPSAAPQVQAVYTFAATVETQLGFNEGDILVLLGEKSEGWQYGLNTKSGR